MKITTTVDPLIIAPRKSNHDLLKLPVVISVTEFNQKASAIFAARMNQAHSHSQPVIPILIDSPGGRVYDLMYMLSIIEQAEKPVVTIGLGQAMSCGSVLLSAGTPGYRYADPNSTIMVHDIAGGAIGKGADIEVGAAETSRLKRLFLRNLDRNCGQKSGYFLNLLKECNNTNIFMTPRQAKKHGLIDHIGTPSLEVSVDVITKFIP